MNKRTVRTTIIYIASLSVFICAFAQANTLLENWRAALLFQLLMFFIINEVWYGLCAWPGIFHYFAAALRSRSTVRSKATPRTSISWECSVTAPMISSLNFPALFSVSNSLEIRLRVMTCRT